MSVPSESIFLQGWRNCQLTQRKSQTIYMLVFLSKNQSTLDWNFCLTILSSVCVLDCLQAE